MNENRSSVLGPLSGRVTVACAAAVLGALLAASAAVAPSASASPSGLRASVDWAAGMTFGPVANVGPGAVADCTLAAVADVEQVLARETEPIDPTPFVAAYDALARAAGEVPGPRSGLRPADVLAAWRAGEIAGTKVRAARLASLDVTTVERALEAGPLYAVLQLPAPASTAPTWVDASGVALSAWSRTAPPAGYAQAGPHVVAVVGYDSADVLVATWGFVQPIAWSQWTAMVTAAWSVGP